MDSKKKSSDHMALTLTRLGFKIFTPVLPHVMHERAYQLWVTPSRIPPSERELAFIDRATSSSIIVDDLKIQLWSWGEGPTVLFLHGWNGRGTQIYSFVDQLNEAGFKVMSFDMPGHGHSDGKQTNAFSVTRATQEILKHIDNLHSVITHSFGSVILGYLYNAQLPLKSLIMLSPPSTLYTALDQFSASLQLPEETKLYIREKLKKTFGSDVFERLSVVKNAAKITQPLLVIHDKNDNIMPVTEGEMVAKAAKRGTFHETHELGHYKILHNDEVIATVVDFVSMV